MSPTATARNAYGTDEICAMVSAQEVSSAALFDAKVAVRGGVRENLADVVETAPGSTASQAAVLGCDIGPPLDRSEAPLDAREIVGDVAADEVAARRSSPTGSGLEP